MNAEEMLMRPLMTALQFSCTFMGNFDSAVKYNIGDIVMKDDSCYMFDGNKMQEIGEVGNVLDTPLYEKEIMPEKCSSCGAPLIRYNGQIRCEYCGTSYR